MSGESLARGAATAERPRRTPTYRRRRRGEAHAGPTYVGRHRVPCQLSRRATPLEVAASVGILVAAVGSSIALVLGAFGHAS